MADYHSIVFNTDRSISSTTAQELTNQAMAKGQAAPDGASTGVRINTASGQTFRMSVSPTGEATPVSQHASFSSVNMGSIPNGEAGILSTLNRGGSVIAASQARADDFVTLPGGITTTLANAERLGFVRNDKVHGYTNVSEPQLREVDGTAERERTQAATQEAQATEAERVSLNAHPVQEIEAAHQTFVSQVSESDKIAMLVQLGQGNVRPQLMHRVAEQMGMTPEAAGEAFKAVELGTRMQLTALARSKGVDVNAFANWARESVRSDRLQQAQQRHVLSRDLVGAWSSLLNDYQRSAKARG